MENQGPSNSSQVIENQDPLMTIESQQQEPKEIRVYQRRKCSYKKL